LTDSLSKQIERKLSAVKSETTERGVQPRKVRRATNAFGFTIDMPVPEMEKLMLALASISDDMLDILGTQERRPTGAYANR